MDDIFSQFGDIFGGFGGFSGFGGFGGSSRGGGVTKGSNLRVKVKLTLQDVASGVEKKIKVKKYNACEACNGSGAKHGTAKDTCSTCHGQGSGNTGNQYLPGTNANCYHLPHLSR